MEDVPRWVPKLVRERRGENTRTARGVFGVVSQRVGYFPTAFGHLLPTKDVRSVV